MTAKQTDGQMELHLHPDRRPLSPRALVVVVAVATFAVLATLTALYAVISKPSFLEQPLTVSVCHPADFSTELGDCPPGAEQVGGGSVVLSEAVFPVAGRVSLDHDKQVAYNIRVEWIPIAGGARFNAGVNVDVSYTNNQDPYGVIRQFAWTPPPAMVASFADAEPGDSLGRWRIIGTATPVRADRFAPYVWDSVETFDLIAG